MLSLSMDEIARISTNLAAAFRTCPHPTAHLARFSSSLLASVVAIQESLAPFSIVGHRSPKVFRSIFHVFENVGSAPLCEFRMAFDGLCLQADGTDARFLEGLRMPVAIPLNEQAVENRMISVPHEPEVRWSVVSRIKVIVVNDCSLPIEIRDFP